MAFEAVLDTCVLWPSLQRDFLLSLAVENLYRPRWSTAILAELEEHEARKLIAQGLPHADAQARAEGLVNQMSGAFPDAVVTGWEALEGTYGLPDPDDEHVVAAAVLGGAGAIVTDNLKHLNVPEVPGHIEVISASEFMTNTVEISPAAAARALTQISRRHRNPPHTSQELLQLLGTR